MVRVPTIAEEDAKRPNRERECLVKERTRLVNRMKGALARLGIRDFKPTLRKAAERLATLHTPDGSPLPPNVSTELQRDLARLGLVVSQIKEVETARQKRLEQKPESEGPHAMVRLLTRVCQRRRENASTGRSKTASRMDAKCLTGGLLLRDKQDEKCMASAGNVPETSSVASPSVLPLPH